MNKRMKGFYKSGVSLDAVMINLGGIPCEKPGPYDVEKGGDFESFSRGDYGIP